MLGSSGNIILQNVYESLLTDLSPKDATLEGFNVYMQGLGELESPASLNSRSHIEDTSMMEGIFRLRGSW